MQCAVLTLIIAGILYEINSRTAECEMKPLTNKSWDSTEGDDHHHIRMRTSEEFFGLNHDDYIYEGQASVRGIQADVFSRIRHSRRHPEKMVNVLCFCDFTSCASFE